MTKFQWSDPFLLEEQLSLEEKMIMKTANQYSQEKLFPRIKSAWKNETMDKPIFHEMGELGLLGCTLPEEYGGINANYVSYGLIANLHLSPVRILILFFFILPALYAITV